ncbi:MAG: hypothetical protein H7Y60_12845 [Rhodospirillaceae bacterium]|nr:hypothetical protein [Rhodospirillales bacterium]
MKNIQTRLTKLEAANGNGDTGPMVIFRNIIDHVGDEPICAELSRHDGETCPHWDRQDGESIDLFQARIAADLPTVAPGRAAYVVMTYPTRH